MKSEANCETFNSENFKLVQEDIDKIRNYAIILANEKDKQLAYDRISRDKGIPYVKVCNGRYMVSMIIDASKKGTFRYFLSTINANSDTDPEVSKKIAEEIIGNEYTIYRKNNFVDFTKVEEKRVNQEKITKKDINKVRKSVVVLNAGNVDEILKGGIKPMLLSNWYKASISVDVLKENLRKIHLSISNSIGKTDPKIAENMARDIIGKGFEIEHYPYSIQFMKVEKEDTMIGVFSNIEEENVEKDGRENVIKEGRENVEKEQRAKGDISKEEMREQTEVLKENEGDVNNGNERGVKKKIQT